MTPGICDAQFTPVTNHPFTAFTALPSQIGQRQSMVQLNVLLLTLLTVAFAAGMPSKASKASNSFSWRHRRFFGLRGGSTKTAAGGHLLDGELTTMVEARTLDDGTVFPVTLSQTLQQTVGGDAAASGCSGKNAADWVKLNRDHLVNDLLPKHGAIVLRGFDVPDPDAFSEVVRR